MAKHLEYLMSDLTYEAERCLIISKQIEEEINCRRPDKKRLLDLIIMINNVSSDALLSVMKDEDQKAAEQDSIFSQQEQEQEDDPEIQDQENGSELYPADGIVRPKVKIAQRRYDSEQYLTKGDAKNKRIPSEEFVINIREILRDGGEIDVLDSRLFLNWLMVMEGMVMEASDKDVYGHMGYESKLGWSY